MNQATTILRKRETCHQNCLMKNCSRSVEVERHISKAHAGCVCFDVIGHDCCELVIHISVMCIFHPPQLLFQLHFVCFVWWLDFQIQITLFITSDRDQQNSRE